MRQASGLGTYFQTVMILRAELGDLFHNLLLLIHLDGKDAAILAAVVQLGNGLAERFVQTGNPGIKNIFHPQKHGHVIAAFLKARDDFRNGDLRPFRAVGADDDIALVIDVEVARTPVADAVKLDGVFRPPLLQSVVFCQCLLLIPPEAGCLSAPCLRAGSTPPRQQPPMYFLAAPASTIEPFPSCFPRGAALPVPAKRA